MNKRHKITLNQELFWDVDFSQIDFEAHKQFIIGRVLEQGDLADYRAIKGYYGLKTIIAAARQLRYLDPKSLNFWSLIFNLSKHKFLAYKTYTARAQSPFLSRLDR